MKYENYIFDLYGTLVDIHTDEENRIYGKNLRSFTDITVQLIQRRN